MPQPESRKITAPRSRRHFFILYVFRLGAPLSERIQNKDVGVLLLLILSAGLGEPTRRISNAASPRQGWYYRSPHFLVQRLNRHRLWTLPLPFPLLVKYKPPSLHSEEKRQVTSSYVCPPDPATIPKSKIQLDSIPKMDAGLAKQLQNYEKFCNFINIFVWNHLSHKYIHVI